MRGPGGRSRPPPHPEGKTAAPVDVWGPGLRARHLPFRRDHTCLSFSLCVSSRNWDFELPFGPNFLLHLNHFCPIPCYSIPFHHAVLVLSSRIPGLSPSPGIRSCKSACLVFFSGWGRLCSPGRLGQDPISAAPRLLLHGPDMPAHVVNPLFSLSGVLQFPEYNFCTHFVQVFDATIVGFFFISFLASAQNHH